MKQTKSVRAFITVDRKVVTKYFYTQEEAEQWKSEIRKQNSDETLEGEIWKSIPNFSRYEASNFGRVKSLDYKRSGISKVIKPAISMDNYLQSVFLDDNGVYQNRKVHFLIALAFLGERIKDYEVNHKNGKKTDNCISNLEYVTRSQNVKHAFDNGLAFAQTGASNGNSKLTDEQVRYIRLSKKNGGRHWGRERIAKELGISSAHIKDIANSKTLWKHILV